jgi:NitT/TauT family transport system substrate-binding protein
MFKIQISRRDFIIKSIAGAAGIVTAPYLTLNVFAKGKDKPIKIAVEFNSHAVPAYVAIDKKMYEAEGLNFTTYKSYATGASLAAGLTRDDIDAAYICLIPAMNVYANAGVPIKVLCGTHLYGYGLAVNPEKVRSVKELNNPNIRIGGLGEGTAVDSIIHKTIERFDLDEKAILSRVRRMSPPKVIFAVKADQLDAVFLPEHWLTMTEQYKFNIMLTARDLWPNMIGSVLIARDSLIKENPEIAEALVKSTINATGWMKNNYDESAKLAAHYLSFESSKTPLADTIENEGELKVSWDYVARSMKNLDYVNTIDVNEVQKTIDYVSSLGNIRRQFSAKDILDLRFLKRG